MQLRWATRQRICEGPPSFQSCVDRDRVDAELVSPGFKTLCTAIVCEHASASTVACLFATSGPSTVARRVVAIVVNAIERLIRWSLAHVRQEVFKGRVPSHAHTNAPTPISGIVNHGFIVAPSPHLQPRVVSARFAEPVSDTSGAGDFSLETPAASSMTMRQIARLYYGLNAAIASTFPTCGSVFSSTYYFQCDKACESLACQIFGTLHTGVYTIGVA